VEDETAAQETGQSAAADRGGEYDCDPDGVPMVLAGLPGYISLLLK
jgi:hypothetical protein